MCLHLLMKKRRFTVAYTARRNSTKRTFIGFTKTRDGIRFVWFWHKNKIALSAANVPNATRIELFYFYGQEISNRMPVPWLMYFL